MLSAWTRRSSRFLAIVGGCSAAVHATLLHTTSTLAAVNTVSCDAADGPLPYKLQHKVQLSADSVLLRYSLPLGEESTLGKDPNLPTCIKVTFPNGTDKKTGEPKALEKSYSPVSHPSAKGFVDLVVKSYPPARGGGVGAYLCNMQVGETMLGELKKQHSKCELMERLVCEGGYL